MELETDEIQLIPRKSYFFTVNLPNVAVSHIQTWSHMGPVSRVARNGGPGP